MSLQSYLQNTNNAPFGLANTNAPGSPYAAAYNRGTTSHLTLPVKPTIFDAQPQQFLDLQYLMAFATEEFPGDEVIWHENVWSRSPIVTTAAIVVTPASPYSTAATTITADSINYCYVGQLLYYIDDNGVANQAIVTAVNTGTGVIALESLSGVTLGAIAGTGVNLTNGMTAGGDGFSTFAPPVRTKTVRRTNLIELIGPEQQIWNRRERLKFRNQSQTNFMETDMRNLLTQLKTSVCQRIWMGAYGEGRARTVNNAGTTAETAIAKFTEGIVPSIINNGGAQISSTMSTVWDDMTDGIFATNFGAINNERVIFGTPEMLHALNLKQKAEFVRYGGGGADRVWDLDFEEWRFAGQRITLVPTQIWNDQASFTEDFSRKLVILQKGNVKLTGMRGEAMISQTAKVSQSRSNVDPVEIYDFERYLVQGSVGTMVQNAAANFVINVA
jgi:hypothetical protein